MTYFYFYIKVILRNVEFYFAFFIKKIFEKIQKIFFGTNEISKSFHKIFYFALFTHRRELNKYIDRVNNNIVNSKKIGGPTAENFLYANYNLPFFLKSDIKYHRSHTSRRIDKISKIIDIKQSTFLDIGCANGGLSFGLMSYGAKHVYGIELDRTVNIPIVLKNIYSLNNVTFLNCDISKAPIPKVDYIVWLSNYMWIEKQFGLQEAAKILFNVVIKSECKGLIFESAAADGAAGIENRTQEDILELLYLYTPFNKIVNHGPFDDKWRKPWKKRNVYFCSNFKRNFSSSLHSVYRVSHDLVIKRYDSKNLWAMKNEISALRKLEKYEQFPKVSKIGDNWILFHYLGHNKEKTKYNKQQITSIIEILNKENIVHRDINPRNILKYFDKLYLIDFEWAVVDGQFYGPKRIPKLLGRGFYKNSHRMNNDIIDSFEKLSLFS